MTFSSILFRNGSDRVPDEHLVAPDFFGDLNLDQIVDAITAGKEEYDLKPFFHSPLHDIDAITWRHEIMRDMENPDLCNIVEMFAKTMRHMRAHLAQAEKLYYQRQKERWFLEAVNAYCAAVTGLIRDLSAVKFTSRGLSAFRDYMSLYGLSNRFTTLAAQTRRLMADLSALRYSILIKGPHVEVRRHAGEADYGTEIETIFAKFVQGSAREYTFTFGDSPSMNHIEAKILDLVAQLYPETFLALEKYSKDNRDFQDKAVAGFDREIQFYIAYLEHIALFKKAGLNFCFPRIVQACKEIYSDQGFDLALAGNLVGDGRASVVCNDFHLTERERIIVVSGPNQGGKTTFARTFGQLHYLASLGCPVPGRRAQLFLFDQLFTHFEREENIDNLRGKLQDDLVRVHAILERATPNSIVIMNEIFTSTALRDAILLSKQIVTEILALDLLCLWVTFVDELASLGAQTVSMVSTVVPENPAQRTYKIVRRPADGLAHAMSIAEKYRLTYAMIKERIRS
jgi:DNA mismatch repair ATPase MutS